MRAWWPWSLALAVALGSGEAHAFCRTTTCNDCPRDDDGCTVGGTKVAWSGRCVGLGIHAEASPEVDYETVERLTE